MARTMRDRTILFYLILTILSLTVIVLLIARGSTPHSKTAFSSIAMHQIVLLDPGHGGLDGGATVEGVSEAPINLIISQKTALLLEFLGQNARLTRTDDQSLDYNPSATARQNKNADLKARLALWKTQPGNPFISIHLNQFSQEKYAGAQVFWSQNDPSSQVLAAALQESMRLALDPQNFRKAKPCGEVFLMEEITGTAVTVECGFLSNSTERGKLQQEGYQTKTAVAIACGYLQFINSQGS